MNSHLNQEQLTEWLLGTENQETARHLESCEACRADSEGVRAAIAGYRQTVHQAAEREQAFWARQRHAILSALPQRRYIHYFRWAATTVMVVVVAAALVLMRSPEPPQQAKNDASDDALLQQVENSIGRSYPAALAPAVLIDEERNRVLSASSAPATQAPAADAAGTSKKSHNRKE